MIDICQTDGWTYVFISVFKCQSLNCDIILTAFDGKFNYFSFFFFLNRTDQSSAFRFKRSEKTNQTPGVI